MVLRLRELVLLAQKELEAEFTQPRDHSFAQPCMYSLKPQISLSSLQGELHYGLNRGEDFVEDI